MRHPVVFKHFGQETKTRLVNPKKTQRMTDMTCGQFELFSSGTDEVRAQRDPSLCNKSVNGHFWFFSNNAVWDEDGNLLLNPIPLSGTS